MIVRILNSTARMIGLLTKYLRRNEKRFRSQVEKYPDAISGRSAADMFGSYRGYLRNDLEKCSGCGVCVPICPVNALQIKSEGRLDGSVSVQEFRIDLGRCYGCSACSEVCPESSLFFSKDFELVSSRAEDLVMVLYPNDLKPEREFARIRTYEVRR
jgi:formate hydrogenlyase subunit 6/NADH:ubiquinone oxidoreductase subunit I